MNKPLLFSKFKFQYDNTLSESVDRDDCLELGFKFQYDNTLSF